MVILAALTPNQLSRGREFKNVFNVEANVHRSFFFACQKICS
jgi:hypothetical protein